MGIHLEGPYISPGKKGAHPPEFIIGLDKGIAGLEKTYGTLENVAIITLAPEIDNAMEVIHELDKKGITVSIGKCCCFEFVSFFIVWNFF